MPLTKEQWDARLAGLMKRQEELISRPNPPEPDCDLGGVCVGYRNPVLTAAHAPLIWRYDMCYEDDPNLLERLGVNAVFNAGAAQTGVIRTKDLMNRERLPNLAPPEPNRRCCCLHPEFVDGKYAFYTRLHDGYFTANGEGGITLALCSDIAEPKPELKKPPRTRDVPLTTGLKNGAGAVPIKTERGRVHIAHGVRATAAGLRYIIYTFATDLNDPSKVIAAPGGQLIAPRNRERVGDILGASFTNGCIVKDENVYIYCAASDTQLNVAFTTLEKLIDYTFNTPEDPLRSVDCVNRRWHFIDKNLNNLNNLNNGEI